MPFGVKRGCAFDAPEVDHDPGRSPPWLMELAWRGIIQEPVARWTGSFRLALADEGCELEETS